MAQQPVQPPHAMSNFGKTRRAMVGVVNEKKRHREIVRNLHPSMQNLDLSLGSADDIVAAQALKQLGWRQLIYRTLERPHEFRVGMVILAVVLSCVLASCLAYFFSSLPDVGSQHPAVVATEWVCTMVFTIELLVRGIARSEDRMSRPNAHASSQNAWQLSPLSVSLHLTSLLALAPSLSPSLSPSLPLPLLLGLLVLVGTLDPWALLVRDITLYIDIVSVRHLPRPQHGSASHSAPLPYYPTSSLEPDAQAAHS